MRRIGILVSRTRIPRQLSYNQHPGVIHPSLLRNFKVMIQSILPTYILRVRIYFFPRWPIQKETNWFRKLPDSARPLERYSPRDEIFAVNAKVVLTLFVLGLMIFDATKPNPSRSWAIFNSTSAQIAYESSADRLELCGEGSSINGGTTPSIDTLETVITSLQRIHSSTEEDGNVHGRSVKILKESIPIYAMIRPRGGDFVYSDLEFEVMKEQLLSLKSAIYPQHNAENESQEQEASSHETTNFFEKVSGFVFGILTPDNKVDRVRNEELVKLAAPLPCTFHRAFDEIISSCQERSGGAKLLPRELVTELGAVISAGFASILTSGGTGRSAVDGAKQIASLIDAADGRIEIIAGGGVRSTNVKELRRQNPRARFFHSSAILGDGDVADANEVLALKRELGSTEELCA
ncbi:copper homeostasis protein, putative [Talaromyces stipitatus ATCC 10500]|uniref:Copper homeostasis protein cutC homolog n=1 Tax=Talaromyces stipitatus (strain ATCC 10500 / CBS 375.48 / QM 6759 / NRRL 1006) TaxID=441959 RepID=B8M4R1_TALSN|nr:copper homeostasis protein, putative [Talaromyces stipitatus ATCC 10500]EED19256.1 copper homeostasis protein, putative [Talaromyces stipitatus ATCC 10500]